MRAAAKRIEPYAHRTPVFTSGSVDRQIGTRVFLKCENFQKGGAFKFRGACNAVFSLSDAMAQRGVVTHSSGNHGTALALAARLRDIPAYVVMPSDAPDAKQSAVRDFGGRITFCEPTLAARESTAEQVIAETGAQLIHPYDDYRIVAGQATAGLEFHEQTPDLDVVFAPVGGGGLASGTALANAAVKPDCQLVLGEPERADDAYRSLKAGRIIPADNPKTIADGLRTSLGQRTFHVLRHHVSEVVLVSEQEIIEAMRWIWSRVKIIIEPSSAVAVAAAIRCRDHLAGRRVGIILSGGNVDLDRLPWQSG
jgi:threonine dehydratase